MGKTTIEYSATADLQTPSKRMSRKITTQEFSALFPSSVRPVHGVFVETRLRDLLKTGEVETEVVAPVPSFPFSGKRVGEYGRFAATPYFERWNKIDIFHHHYYLPLRVGMKISSRTTNLLETSTVGENLALFNEASPDNSSDTLSRLSQDAPFRQQVSMASLKSIDFLKLAWTDNAPRVLDLAEKQPHQTRKREVT